MLGYKGFGPGMVCRGKQYAENTVFEEPNAEICRSGMHFCENPLDVLEYYPLISDSGELNEFAEVEALDDVKTDDGKKFCTKRLRIGAKLSIGKLGSIAGKFLREKLTAAAETEISNGGVDANQVVGNNAQQVGGDWAKQIGGNNANQVVGNNAKQVGGVDAKQKAGKNSVIVAGKESCFCGGLHSLLIAYWHDDNGEIAGYKVAQVDGATIKADTWYKIKDGEFVEVA